jgi:hypothetical protein
LFGGTAAQVEQLKRIEEGTQPVQEIRFARSNGFHDFGKTAFGAERLPDGTFLRDTGRTFSFSRGAATEKREEPAPAVMTEEQWLAIEPILAEIDGVELSPERKAERRKELARLRQQKHRSKDEIAQAAAEAEERATQEVEKALDHIAGSAAQQYALLRRKRKDDPEWKRFEAKWTGRWDQFYKGKTRETREALNWELMNWGLMNDEQRHQRVIRIKGTKLGNLIDELAALHKQQWEELLELMERRAKPLPPTGLIDPDARKERRRQWHRDRENGQKLFPTGTVALVASVLMVLPVQAVGAAFIAPVAAWAGVGRSPVLLAATLAGALAVGLSSVPAEEAAATVAAAVPLVGIWQVLPLVPRAARSMLVSIKS